MWLLKCNTQEGVLDSHARCLYAYKVLRPTGFPASHTFSIAGRRDDILHKAVRWSNLFRIAKVLRNIEGGAQEGDKKKLVSEVLTN